MSECRCTRPPVACSLYKRSRDWRTLPVLTQITSNDNDLDLARRVTRAFAAGQRPGLRQLSVEASRGTIRVSGRVGTYYERQLSQQFARRVPGVLDIIDEVQVDDFSPHSAGSWSESLLYQTWAEQDGV